ncbi:nucleoside monophosphate kinase [Candidatus Woesearchaeota archaeon]|nr:nucleoside monophosphate kinase [Candidatus Woesearchaeota archaeon]
MKLIIVGPPGSGKGTIAKRLIPDFKLTHISPGEMLREEVSKKTSLGEEINKYISQGQLVPDNVVSDMVKLKIRGHPDFVLDGFPRTVEQAQILDKFTKIDLVLSLDVSEKISVERLSGRRVCSKCETPFHIKFMMPKKPGVCDKCGGKLVQRSDEKPAIVKERFKIYHQQSLPVVKHYQKKKILQIVDASGAPEEVYDNIKEAINSLKK